MSGLPLSLRMLALLKLFLSGKKKERAVQPLILLEIIMKCLPTIEIILGASILNSLLLRAAKTSLTILEKAFRL